MKKTILFFILVIFVASIAVVNLFGLQAAVHDGTNYVTGIKCETITLLDGENKPIEPYAYYKGGIPVFVFEFKYLPNDEEYTTDEASLAKNPNVIQLNVEVLPHNADNPALTYLYDEESYEGDLVFSEEHGAFVVLTSTRLFFVTIKSTDGSNVSTTIGFIGL